MRSDPYSETEKRRAIARRAVDLLAARTRLAASLLAGSAGQGTSDSHSDVDLLNYYEDLPDPAAFDRLMSELGGARAADISRPTPEGFSASYRFEGVEVQTGGQSVAGVEARLRRIEAGDVDWVTAKVAMGLLEGLPLYGEAIIAGWQARARAYPESLRRSEVEANLGIFPVWELDEHLAARDAELFRRQMLLDGAFRVLAVLSGVNRLYFTSFQFKRAGAHAARMRVKPDRLVERLDRVANAPPNRAARELHALVDETRAIVAAEMPDVDLDVRWRPRA